MKSSTKTLFVLLAIVMCFVTVQAVWALKGPGCITVVSGVVSEILLDENAIVVGDDTIYGVPVDEWNLDIEVGDSVVINVHVCLDTGRLVACYVTVYDGEIKEIIDLRPRSTK